MLAVVVPATYADEEARISPPGGFTSQARISPPTGFTSPEPSVFALLIEWLRTHARIQIPLG